MGWILWGQGKYDIGYYIDALSLQVYFLTYE